MRKSELQRDAKYAYRDAIRDLKDAQADVRRAKSVLERSKIQKRKAKKDLLAAGSTIEAAMRCAY